MKDIDSKINNLKSGVQNLIHLHRQLRAENENLSEANRLLSEEIEKKSKELQESEYIKRLPETADNGQLKARINELVREIDRCIALLS